MKVAKDIRLSRVTKRYGDITAVDNVSFEVERGEFLTLLGPSGCGKTTTLNMIAGFVQPTSGSIWIQDKPVTELPPYKRNTGMVFQSYALFPHMTVFENVAFGLQMHNIPANEVKSRVDDMLARVQLANLDKRYPRQLSGGQQQRVALARAMVIQPAVLLLDEPLSNLDLKLREAMRFELKSLQRELGITSVYVTHDQDEALVMSDRIAVMSAGRIEQVGSPSEIYDKPKSLFVATFIGATNLLRGTIYRRVGNELEVELSEETIRVIPSSELATDAEITISIRPEKCSVIPRKETTGNCLGAMVREILVLGADLLYRLELRSGQQFTVRTLNTDGVYLPTIGSKVGVLLPAHHCLAFPFAGKSRLEITSGSTHK